MKKRVLMFFAVLVVLCYVGCSVEKPTVPEGVTEESGAAAVVIDQNTGKAQVVDEGAKNTMDKAAEMSTVPKK